MINSQRYDQVLKRLLQTCVPVLKAFRGRLAGEVAREGAMTSWQPDSWDFDPVETLRELDELISEIEDALEDKPRGPLPHLSVEEILVLAYRVLMILDLIMTMSDKLPL